MKIAARKIRRRKKLVAIIAENAFFQNISTQICRVIARQIAVEKCDRLKFLVILKIGKLRIFAKNAEKFRKIKLRKMMISR